MPYTRKTWKNDTDPTVSPSDPRVSAEEFNRIEAGIEGATATAEQALAAGGGAGNTGVYGAVALDSFVGASDDAKLTAALSYAAAQTFIPAIAMPTTRRATFSQTGRVPFSGMKLIGGPGGNRNPELSSGKFITSNVTLNVGNGTSSWFVGSGSLYNILVKDIGFQAQGTGAQFWHHPSSSGTLYSCRFESLGFNLFKHVMGTSGANVGLTQVELAGHWTVNNARDVQFNFGGSDNQLWMDGYINIGTGQDSTLAGDGTKFYIVFSTLSNTQVGYLYGSGLNGWNVLKVTGNSDGVDFYGGVFEGYKASGTTGGGKSLANPGNVVRLEGGSGNFFGGNFGQGMAEPDATHHGLIEVTGGEWNFYGPNFYRGAKAETSPAIYQSGGRVAVISAKRRQSETWSARPRYQTVGGTFDVWPTSSMTAI